MKKKKNKGQVVLHMVFLVLMAVYILPILVLIASSFTDETALIQNGYSLIPSVFSMEAYETAFRNPMKMILAYGVNIFYTIAATALSTLVIALLAYPLSRDTFIWRKQLNFFVYFTMLFSGGLVPSYLLIRNILHMDDTIWVYIVPCLVSAYNVLIVRTSYRAIPNELVEAAKIDGARELYICFRIIIPLSKASIASVSFLYMVDRWNDWMTSMLYIRNPDLYSLQYLLQKLLREAEALKNYAAAGDASAVMPAETLRFAMALVAAGPVLMVFPFFQKYFTKGMTLGGVKG